ncbi:MAG: transcriptional repressor [Candidatus Cloacimonetes bacterium]|nr:transcriptional repressor [Candidatus Cloacimonadota bacterium]MCF7867239.1 transcriptional repressor [Candidatus Cloacimonadota bacterium]MCF7882683.1 transcriptional repressor [Candidatus Cloacimonadota bacterium]
MKSIIQVLKEHDIAPSMQRVKILEYLQNYKTHPTADMIYKALVKDIPTLSKTTVYNTLKTFIDKGILVALTLFENEVRYEYNTNPHIHFKCIKCKKIYDLDKAFDGYNDNVIDGHKVIEHHVNLKGVCRKCLKEEK